MSLMVQSVCRKYPYSYDLTQPQLARCLDALLKCMNHHRVNEETLILRVEEATDFVPWLVEVGFVWLHGTKMHRDKIDPSFFLSRMNAKESKKQMLASVHVSSDLVPSLGVSKKM